MMFLPSTHGFRFDNIFPDEPVLKVSLPMIGEVGVGNASGGMCGGMVFAAADHYHAGRPVPQTTEPPPGDSLLFQYIAKRLLDSFNIPLGLAELYRRMAFVGDRALAAESFHFLTAVETMLRGGPVPLTLVLASSLNPAKLGENHQVLAYALDRSGEEVAIRIYDPNWSGHDGVQLICTPSGVRYSAGHGGVVRGFYPTKYEAIEPWGGR